MVSLGLRRTSLIYLLLNLILVAAGVFLTSRHSNIASSVGTSLIATGVAGWIMFLYIAVGEDRRERLDRLVEMGFYDAFEARSVAIKPFYDRQLTNAHRGVDILGFGLSLFREDYRSEFSSWAERMPVRILLIDPDSPYAAARDREEGQDEGTISRQVNRFLDDTGDLRREKPDRFQVRLYSAIPTFNVFRIDDFAFYGPYLLRQPSRSSPTLLIRRGVLYDRLVAHFDELWGDEFSRPAP